MLKEVVLLVGRFINPESKKPHIGGVQTYQ